MTLGWRTALDADDSRSWWKLHDHSVQIADYFTTEMGKWWRFEWGHPNKGSICPSAPQRGKSRRIASPFSLPGDKYYAGAYNTAWAAEGPSDWLWWWGADRREMGVVRAGSYAPNGWLGNRYYYGFSADSWFKYPQPFRNEADVTRPAQTPVFGDGIYRWIVGFYETGPYASDLPPADLRTGGGEPYGMRAFALPRHGSTPSHISRNHPASVPLPGAVNISFFDGHVEPVKLDRLWQLYWHKDYAPPGKRPGLR
jgi:prepilin-type processing-associated H-X9-DG protein